MCIVFLSRCTDSSKPYQLVVACNRDEFYDRHTIPARFWPEPATASHIIAGKDAVNGGSWIGFSRKGRFAVLTNYRKEFRSELFKGRSRGKLVLDYLMDEETTPTQYCTQVTTDHSQFDGFNLIVGNLSTGNQSKELVYCSNRSDKGVCPLVGGVYGLSNSTLDVPWSKVKEGKTRFSEILDTNVEKEELVTQLQELLSDKTCYYPDPQTHSTNHPEHWMRGMSSIFARVPGERYGTRSSTVILVDREGVVTYVEKTMKEPIADGISWMTSSQTFKIE